MQTETKTNLNLSKDQEERAVRLHRDSIVINALETLFKTSYDNMRDYFRRWKESGITAANVTISKARDPGFTTENQGFRATMKDTCRWIRILREYPDSALQVLSVEDIRRAKEEGKAGIIFGFQYAGPIEDELGFLSIFYRLGFRVMGLCYQHKGLIGDGCEERTDAGLSKFGVQVVEEMNRLGILIDLSHSGRKSSMEAIEFSKEPAIFSHTNANTLCSHSYNQTDEVIKAMAEKGGVIGIIPTSQYLTARGAMEGSTMADYLHHVDYLVKLVGVDHVGVGLDILEGEDIENQLGANRLWPGLWKADQPFALEKKHTVGLQSITGTSNITRGLVARGYSDQEIKKIIGGNFLRAFEKVWK